MDSIESDLGHSAFESQPIYDETKEDKIKPGGKQNNFL